MIWGSSMAKGAERTGVSELWPLVEDPTLVVLGPVVGLVDTIDTTDADDTFITIFLVPLLVDHDTY